MKHPPSSTIFKLLLRDIETLTSSADVPQVSQAWGSTAVGRCEVEKTFSLRFHSIHDQQPVQWHFARFKLIHMFRASIPAFIARELSVSTTMAGASSRRQDELGRPTHPKKKVITSCVECHRRKQKVACIQLISCSCLIIPVRSRSALQFLLHTRCT